MNKLERLKLSRNFRRLSSLLEKKILLRSFFCCSSNNSQIFFSFSFFGFNYIVLLSLLWSSGEWQLPAVTPKQSTLCPRKQLLELDLLKRAKQILMSSFPDFLMIQFAEFNLLEWRPSHGPELLLKNVANLAKYSESWLGCEACKWSFALRTLGRLFPYRKLTSSLSAGKRALSLMFFCWKFVVLQPYWSFC